MAFGGFHDNNRPAPMAEINVTPMVDVMLVLLVIFIIAAPLFTHAVKLELPQAQSKANQEKPNTITLAIDGEGKLFWNNEQLERSELEARLLKAAQVQPAPDLQLRADKATRYEVIAQVMSLAQASGVARMGFVTEAASSSR